MAAEPRARASRLIRRTVIAAAVAGCVSTLSRAQGSPLPGPGTELAAKASSLTFDVVSFKPNKSGSGAVRVMMTTDGIHASNVSMKMLIAMAHGIKEDLVYGTAKWVESDRFDFDAKVAGADVGAYRKLSREDRQVLIQSALIERLQMKAHHETRQLPIFELVVAKGGPKLKEAVAGDTYPNGFKGPDGIAHPGMMHMQPGELTCQGLKAKALADQLANVVHRTVIDKTGLTGTYDFSLTWTPDPDTGAMGGSGGGGAHDNGADTSGPSLFTALQEQLGLRLEASKGPVDTLVVDHIEPPSEN